MIGEVNQYRDDFDIDIEKALEETYQIDRADRFYNTTCKHMDSVIEEGGMLLTEIIEDCTTRILNARRDEERDQIEKEANDRVENWVSIFDPLKDEFVQAEDMYPENHIGKHNCENKRDEVDNTVTEFKELMRIKIAQAIEQNNEVDLYEDELLQLYHDTTVHNNAEE